MGHPKGTPKAETRDIESDSQRAGNWAESKAGKWAGLTGSWTELALAQTMASTMDKT